MLYTKIQHKRFIGSGEEVFKEILPYMDMVASCSIARNHLNKLAIPFRQKVHAQAVSEKTLKNYTILYMYIAQWQGQITLKRQNFDYI